MRELVCRKNVLHGTLAYNVITKVFYMEQCHAAKMFYMEHTKNFFQKGLLKRKKMLYNIRVIKIEREILWVR